MKICVTGGAGFIGSHLVDALIGADHRVTVIDDLSTGQKENLSDKIDKFYHVDITEQKEIQQLFKKEKFDAVFHLAAQMNVRVSVADPQFDARVNILGSLNLLQASLASNVKKIIVASTGGAMYGEAKKRPTPEDEKYAHPVSPYGIAKLSLEHYLHYYYHVYRMPYIALRYANVYGPRQNAKGEAGVVAIFIERLKAGEAPVINGDGKQTRDFVYVADVVAANLAALKKNTVGSFNIGTGLPTSVNRVYQLIAKAGGVNLKAKHGPAKLGEQRHSVLNCVKAQRVLGWRPHVDITDGITRTVEWFLNRS